MSILVFDSGIGGLSIFREVRIAMPGQQIIYVGDDAGFPYGDWQGEALAEHIVRVIETLLNRYQIELAIIACNTASTMILPALRAKFDLPFVGTVPAIKPAAERTQSKMISVLGTPGTVGREYVRHLIDEFASDVDVNLVGAGKLARIAEYYMQQQKGRLDTSDQQELLEEIRPCFKQSGDNKTDIVVLGCTHYPFLVNQMRRLAPWPVDWLEPSEAIAHRARALLTSSDDDISESLPDPDLAVFTSGTLSPPIKRLLNGFGFNNIRLLDTL